jgi:hypothetical protein
MISVKMIGVDKAIKGLKKAVAKSVKAAQWAANKTAQNIEADAVKNLDRNKSVFRSTLKQDIEVKITRKKNMMIWRVGAFNNKVGTYIEFGTGPASEKSSKTFFPPWKQGTNLYKWVSAKFGLSGTAAESASFAVAKGLHEHGSKGRPWLRPAYYKNIKRLVASMVARIKKV